jgi:HK97 family phage major capsid protein
MDILKIKAKIAAGEQLTPEELNFLMERSTADPQAGLADAVGAAIERAMQPLLAAQRNFNPAGGTEPDPPAYTPKRNRFTDLVRSVRNREFDLIVERKLSEGTDSEGGYLVPTETMAEIVKYIGEYGVGRRDATVVPIGISSLNLNTRDSGLTAYYVNEASQITASSQVYSQVTVAAKKLAVMAGPIGNELIADANVDLQAEVSEDTGDAFAYAEDYQVFQGNGTTFTGVLHHASVNEVTLTGAVANISYEKLNEMVYKIPAPRLTGAKFYAHRTVLEKLHNVVDGDGRPMFRESTILGQPSTLLGYPVVATEACPTADTVSSGDGFLVLGNLRNVRIYDLEQMTMKLLTEGTVNSVNLGETDQSAIRFIERHIIVVRRPAAMVRMALA